MSESCKVHKVCQDQYGTGARCGRWQTGQDPSHVNTTIALQLLSAPPPIPHPYKWLQLPLHVCIEIDHNLDDSQNAILLYCSPRSLNLPDGEVPMLLLLAGLYRMAPWQPITILHACKTSILYQHSPTKIKPELQQRATKYTLWKDTMKISSS